MPAHGINHIHPKDNKIPVTKCHSTTSSYTTLQVQFFLLTIYNLGALETPPPSKKTQHIFSPNCPTSPRSGSSNNDNYDGPSHFAPLWLHRIWTRKNFPVAPHRSSLPGQGAETHQAIRRNAMGENATPWLEGRKLTHKFGEEGSLLWGGKCFAEMDAVGGNLGCWFFSIIGNFGGMEWHGSWIRSDMPWKWQIWDLGYSLFFVHFLLVFKSFSWISRNPGKLKWTFRYQIHSNLNYPSKLLRTPKWPKTDPHITYNAW